MGIGEYRWVLEMLDGHLAWRNVVHRRSGFLKVVSGERWGKMCHVVRLGSVRQWARRRLSRIAFRLGDASPVGAPTPASEKGICATN